MEPSVMAGRGVEDIPGVGKILAKKLKGGGYTTIGHIADAKVEEIVRDCKIRNQDAWAMIERAKIMTRHPNGF